MSVTKAALQTYCLSLGARRDGSRWILAGQDTIAVLELQRSQYGPLDYLNLGWYLRALGEETRPRFPGCHIKVRFDSVLPQAVRSEWKRVTDLDTPMADAERGAMIEQYLGTYLTPILDQAATLDGLRSPVGVGLRASALWVDTPAESLITATSISALAKVTLWSSDRGGTDHSWGRETHSLLIGVGAIKGDRAEIHLGARLTTVRGEMMTGGTADLAVRVELLHSELAHLLPRGTRFSLWAGQTLGEGEMTSAWTTQPTP
jgi:hypothetical protein